MGGKDGLLTRRQSMANRYLGISCNVYLCGSVLARRRRHRGRTSTFPSVACRSRSQAIVIWRFSPRPLETVLAGESGPFRLGAVQPCRVWVQVDGFQPRTRAENWRTAVGRRQKKKQASTRGGVRWGAVDGTVSSEVSPKLRVGG